MKHYYGNWRDWLVSALIYFAPIYWGIAIGLILALVIAPP